jgi:hypothetical protein
MSGKRVYLNANERSYIFTLVTMQRDGGESCLAMAHEREKINCKDDCGNCPNGGQLQKLIDKL